MQVPSFLRRSSSNGTAPKPNGHAPAPAITVKPLDAGESIPVVGADDLKGTNPAELERQIGQLFLQALGLARQHQHVQARAGEVMRQHLGAPFDDKDKVHVLDTAAMVIRRVR